MKIILKRRHANLWLHDNGKWISDRNKAQEFDFGTDAIVAAAAAGPEDVQVYFEAEDPNLSFELGRERGDIAFARAHR